MTSHINIVYINIGPSLFYAFVTSVYLWIKKTKKLRMLYIDAFEEIKIVIGFEESYCAGGETIISLENIVLLIGGSVFLLMKKIEILSYYWVFN